MQAAKPTALITGASSGIGREIALQLAARGYELILVARRTAHLASLADTIYERHRIASHILPCDLQGANAHQEIVRFIEQKQLSVEVLVNNAGFGDNHLFAETELTRMHEMLQVNVRALVDLTYYFLPKMLQKKKGYILNVASTAAMQPVPYMSVYAASKAFVLSFSEALNEENRERGISITALCPGPTNSEFAQAANMQESKLFNLPILRPLSSAYVAKCGLQALFAHKRRVIPGLRNKLMMFLSAITPKSWSLRLTKLFTQGR